MINSQPVDNMMGKKNPVLMKSKHRVQKHGEVFTPQWVIDKMIAIPGIKEKTEDVYATFLEPSAGEGAFLLAIEDMKLQFITDNYSIDTWDRYALWALSSIYGIEFLEDNLAVARQNMLELFINYYETIHNAQMSEQSNLYKSARTIIWANVVQGDTLTHKNLLGECITFSHWERVPDTLCKVQRTPFTYSSLLTDDKQENSGTQMRLFETEEQLGIFTMIDSDKEGATQPQRYAIVDIEQVWRGEKENVG
ncbi:MAG: N-6 DNA methylase [Negativicutes bacterium]|nr:N-6 DNA methylase [Negativicutes bacterium]